MKIVTIGELTQDLYIFGSFIPVKAEDMKEKTSTNPETKITKTVVAPDGSNRPVHNVVMTALRLDEEGTVVGQDANIRLSVINPTDIEPGIMYGLSGYVHINHYKFDSDRSITAAVIAEDLKPLTKMKKFKVEELMAVINRPTITVPTKS